MNPQTDWATALAILSAGLILGVFFIYFSKKRKAATINDTSDALTELELRRDSLVEQLRDPAVQGSERARLEQETADVLRQLDGAARKAAKRETAGATPVTPEAASPASFAKAMKGFGWGVVTFGMLAGLGYVVMQQAAPREAGASMTGAIPSDQPQQPAGHPAPAPTDARVAKLQEEIKKNPTDIQLRLALAQTHMQRNDLMGVHDVTKVILERDPENSLGLTYAAVVRAAMGDTDVATEMLHRAAKNQPANLDAYVALAWVEAQRGNVVNAEKAIASGIAAVPTERAMLSDVMEQIRTQMKTTAETTPSKPGLPPGHPPTEVAMKK